MPAGPVSRLWLRYLRFSVRGLIVLVLVIGLGLGWIVRQAHIQRDAVAAIRKAGGSVMYSWEWRDGSTIPGGKPWAPQRLVDLIGVDYFGHVTQVWLPLSSEVTDATLAHVGRLTRLQELFVRSPYVSDAGLEHLKDLTNLTDLTLAGRQITDAGLVHLKKLISLSKLWLPGARVTDAGMNDLKRALPTLRISK